MGRPAGKADAAIDAAGSVADAPDVSATSADSYADDSAPFDDRGAEAEDDARQDTGSNLPNDVGSGVRRATRDAGDAETAESGPPDAPVPTDGGRCRAFACEPRSWACWPMPNAPGSGLPDPAGYADPGDGTVLDLVTCLEWQRDVTRNSPGFGQADAAAYCAGLELAGGGWRLPIRIELLSIVDPSVTTPPIDLNTFVNAPPAYFWTTSRSGRGESSDPLGWFVDFYSGQAGTSNGVAWYRARCVRGGASREGPPSHYTTPMPGQVRDEYTGLVWQEEDSADGDGGGRMSFTEGATYCDALRLGGEVWRLPSMKELATLIDDRATTGPAIDREAFPTTTAAAYWSTTPFADGGGAWSVDFADGSTGYAAKMAIVRCVR